MASWKQEYDAFKERKRARKLASRQENKCSSWPSVVMDKEKLRVVTNNMFDVLAVDDGATVSEAPENVVGSKPVKPAAAKLTGWATMAAKPAKPVTVPFESAAENTTAGNVLDFTREEMLEFDAELLEWDEERKSESMNGVSWGDEAAWAE